MPQLHTITELRNNKEISEIWHAQKELVINNKKGYGGLVVMSIETYEEMLENRALDAAVFEAEAQYAADKTLHDARASLAGLRRKHLG